MFVNLCSNKAIELVGYWVFIFILWLHSHLTSELIASTILGLQSYDLLQQSQTYQWFSSVLVKPFNNYLCHHIWNIFLQWSQGWIFYNTSFTFITNIPPWNWIRSVKPSRNADQQISIIPNSQIINMDNQWMLGHYFLSNLFYISYL